MEEVGDGKPRQLDDGFLTTKEKTMAETIGVKLPPEMTVLFDEIRAVRAANFEPLTNTAIVIDAIKDYHRKRVQK